MIFYSRKDTNQYSCLDFFQIWPSRFILSVNKTIKICKSLMHTFSHISITNVLNLIVYTSKDGKRTFKQTIGSFYSCCKPASSHNKRPLVFYYDPSNFLKFSPISAGENRKLPWSDPPGNLVWESIYYNCLLFLIIWFLLNDNFSQKTTETLLLHHTIKIVKNDQKKSFPFFVSYSHIKNNAKV